MTCPIFENLSIQRSACLASVILLCLSAPAHAADTKPVAKPATGSKPTAATNAPAPVVVIPKSVFVDDPKVGKDPFFPTSERRNPKPASPTTTTTTTTTTPGVAPAVAQNKDLSRFLKLKGISISKTLRLAVIHDGSNEITLATGEVVDMKTPGGPIKVRCVEIKDKSVVLTIEGEARSKEIFVSGEL